jgi:formylmethanofuran dehydrogenase subunit E
MNGARIMNFLRVCTRCHHPREAYQARVIHGKFVCAQCLRELHAKELRHAMES